MISATKKRSGCSLTTLLGYSVGPSGSLLIAHCFTSSTPAERRKDQEKAKHLYVGGSGAKPEGSVVVLPAPAVATCMLHTPLRPAALFPQAAEQTMGASHLPVPVSAEPAKTASTRQLVLYQSVSSCSCSGVSRSALFSSTAIGGPVQLRPG